MHKKRRRVSDGGTAAAAIAVGAGGSGAGPSRALPDRPGPSGTAGTRGVPSGTARITTGSTPAHAATAVVVAVPAAQRGGSEQPPAGVPRILDFGHTSRRTPGGTGMASAAAPRLPTAAPEAVPAPPGGVGTASLPAPTALAGPQARVLSPFMVAAGEQYGMEVAGAVCVGMVEHFSRFAPLLGGVIVDDVGDDEAAFMACRRAALMVADAIADAPYPEEWSSVGTECDFCSQMQGMVAAVSGESFACAGCARDHPEIKWGVEVLGEVHAVARSYRNVLRAMVRPPAGWLAPPTPAVTVYQEVSIADVLAQPGGPFFTPDEVVGLLRPAQLEALVGNDKVAALQRLLFPAAPVPWPPVGSSVPSSGPTTAGGQAGAGSVAAARAARAADGGVSAEQPGDSVTATGGRADLPVTSPSSPTAAAADAAAAGSVGAEASGSGGEGADVPVAAPAPTRDLPLQCEEGVSVRAGHPTIGRLLAASVAFDFRNPLLSKVSAGPTWPISCATVRRRFLNTRDDRPHSCGRPNALLPKCRHGICVTRAVVRMLQLSAVSVFCGCTWCFRSTVVRCRACTCCRLTSPCLSPARHDVGAPYVNVRFVRCVPCVQCRTFESFQEKLRAREVPVFEVYDGGFHRSKTSFVRVSCGSGTVSSDRPLHADQAGAIFGGWPVVQRNVDGSVSAVFTCTCTVQEDVGVCAVS